MKTVIQTNAQKFIINGQPTYLRRVHNGRNIEGLLFNAREDSIHLDNLETAVDEYVSWGHYSRGYGCGGNIQHGRFNWLAHGHETQFEALSGFLSIPVNWGINTAEKRAFFERVRLLAGLDG